MLINQLLYRNRYSNKIAIVCGNNKTTYCEWYKLSLNIGKLICLENGTVKKNIGIFLPNSIEYAVAYFAIAFSNNVIVPIHIKSSNDEIRNEINYCELDMILTSRKHLGTLTKSLCESNHKIKIILVEENKVLTYGRSGKTLKSQQDELDDVAIMLHTSGTTSNPKKVMLTHNNIISNIKSNIESLKLDSSYKTLIALPMCFGYCNTSQFLTSVYLGATMVIMEGIFMPQSFFKIVEREKISHFTAVPTMLKILLDYKYYENHDYSSLKIILFGGGKISVDLLRKLNEKYNSINFCQTYGQTECSPRVTLLSPNESIERINSVGKPIPEVKIEIRNKYDKKEKAGVVGRIWVYGQNVMKGYYKQPEITNSIIKNGWINTGDLGYLDEKGYLYLVGREKCIIISGGMNIYPEEVEEVISSYKGIKDVCVVAKRNELLGEISIAYVVLEDDKISKKNIRNYCLNKLSEYKVPKDIIIVKELKKTKTGKIKRGINDV